MYRITQGPHASSDASFLAMQRHAAAQGGGKPPAALPPTTPPPDDDDPIVYGARAIALSLFGEDSNKARRRVYCLWDHYGSRKERVGLFKLKGGLCLSKSVWKKFHGLD